MRTFQEIQQSGYYESDAERAQFLTQLISGGQPVSTDAQTWLSTWSQQQQNNVPAQEAPGQYTGTPGQPAATGNNNWLNIVQGLDLKIEEQRNATELQKQELAGQYNTKIAEINQAGELEKQKQERALYALLQSGQITSEEYIRRIGLIPTNVDTAQKFALAQLSEQHNYEVNKLTAETAQRAQALAERQLAAQMAANPNDLIAYEFFKRGAGAPSEYNSASNFQSAGKRNRTNQSQTVGTTQPAYSDSAIQQTAAGLFNPSTASYNPGLSGTGAFGAKIEAPNSLSRSEGLALTDQQMQMLGSVLRGGVQTRPGDDSSRVAIDPAEYFKQANASWIPTLASTPQTTQYR